MALQPYSSISLVYGPSTSMKASLVSFAVAMPMRIVRPPSDCQKHQQKICRGPDAIDPSDFLEQAQHIVVNDANARQAIERLVRSNTPMR
jgi:hypothetical protein